MSLGIFDWVKTIALISIAAGVLPFLYHQIELAQARLATEKVTKKTKNLAFALNIAKGAVGLAEKLSGGGQAQETSAVLAIRQRLQENNMSGLFTDEQLRQIIQQAYAAMKTSGELDALKVSDSSNTPSEQILETVTEGTVDSQSEASSEAASTSDSTSEVDSSSAVSQ